MDYFFDDDEATIKKEREKAREMRKSAWWQRRISSGRCHYCNAEVGPKALTLDHVVPVARGGKTVKGNCVAACKECNNRKKHLLPIEWEEYLNGIGFTPPDEDEI